VSAAREPEIFTAEEWQRRERQRHDLFNDDNLERLASLLDDGFRVPGTSISFGLDPIVGLLPGIGDFLTSLLSFAFLIAAWRRRLPRITQARIVANIAIDTLCGTLPIVGDLFDVYWKANRKNLVLLQRSTRHPEPQTWRDWLFFGILALVVAGLALLPIVVAVWIVRWMRG